jgi:hypothetical protein
MGVFGSVLLCPLELGFLFMNDYRQNSLEHLKIHAIISGEIRKYSHNIIFFCFKIVFILINV